MGIESSIFLLRQILSSNLYYIRVAYDNRAGILRWRGSLKNQEGEWAGIELDEPLGKNNGSFGGKSYFKCKDGKGLFKPMNTIELVTKTFG